MGGAGRSTKVKLKCIDGHRLGPRKVAVRPDKVNL